MLLGIIIEARPLNSTGFWRLPDDQNALFKQDAAKSKPFTQPGDDDFFADQKCIWGSRVNLFYAFGARQIYKSWFRKKHLFAARATLQIVYHAPMAKNVAFYTPIYTGLHAKPGEDPVSKIEP